VVLVGVVGVVVHAEHDGYVRIGRRRRDHHLLRAGVDVLLRAVAIGEEPGRLDHELDAEVSPRKGSRILLGKHLQLTVPGLDDPVVDVDVLVELPEHGVVLQKVSHRLGVTEIVDGDDVEVPTALEVSTEKVPPNPPKPVDPNACLSHEYESNGGRPPRPLRLPFAAEAGFASLGRNRSPVALRRNIIMPRVARRMFRRKRRAGGEAPRTTSSPG
jgi:hypothetical protein